MSAWIWILIVVVAVVTAIVVTTLIVRRNDARKVGFMMDALEDGELNFHFKEKSALNQALNRIKGIFERRDAANEERCPAYRGRRGCEGRAGDHFGLIEGLDPFCGVVPQHDTSPTSRPQGGDGG